jgi:uncharacterized protein YfiM (DUF2279 family)
MLCAAPIAAWAGTDAATGFKATATTAGATADQNVMTLDHSTGTGTGLGAHVRIGRKGDFSGGRHAGHLLTPGPGRKSPTTSTMLIDRPAASPWAQPNR